MYTYFEEEFFMILHALLALTLIYWQLKSKAIPVTGRGGL
jgi:hypothetical protein